MLTCMLLMAAVLVSGREAEAASKKKAALKAYTSFLSGKSINWDGALVPLSKCSFTLAYIDKDTVPELVVCSNYNTSHAAGYYRLYTYKKGKVVFVDNLMDGFSYYKKKGVYCGYHAGTGGEETYYHKFSKAKTTYKLYMMDERSLAFDVNGDGKIGRCYEKVTKARNPYYRSATKKITKSEFNKQLKKLVGKTKKTTVRKYYANTASNRKKRLK